MAEPSHPRLLSLALAGILLLAALIRWPALNLGLPEFCNGDEAKLDQSARRMVQRLSLDPGNQNYPALMFDLAAAADFLSILIPEIRAVIHLESRESFRYWIARQPLPMGRTVFWGRWLSLACGLASLLLFHHVVRIHADANAAILATFLLAVAPAHQWLSVLLKTDTLLLLALLLSLHAGFRIGQQGRNRDYALGALALGLALATKYYFLAAIPLVAGAALNGAERSPWSRLRDRRLWLMLLFAGVLFAILSPYSLIHWREAVAWIAAESASQAGAVPLFKRTTGRLWHAPGLFMLTSALPFALGIPLYLLALAGLPDLFRLARPAKSAWLSFALGFLVIYSLGSKLGSPHIYFLIVPPLCLAGGLFLRRRLASPKLPRRILWAVLLAIAAIYSLAFFRSYLEAEKRSLAAAAEYLHHQIPPGATAAVFTPYWPDRSLFPDTINFYPYSLLTPENLAAYHPDFVFAHQGWFRLALDNPENLDVGYRTFPELQAGKLGYTQVWEITEPWDNERLYGFLLPDLVNLFSFAAFQREDSAAAP